MKKAILISILSFLFIVGIAQAAPTLWHFYLERGEQLPSMSERAEIYSNIANDAYYGLYEQNIALLDYLEYWENWDRYFEEEEQIMGGATGSVNLPLILADFETSLQDRINSTQTTMTLIDGTDDDGNTLNGYYGFTIDAGSASQEYVVANCSGTSCSSMTRGVSVSTGTTTVAALRSSHGRGASVQITDHPNITIITNILNGVQNVPDKLTYDSSVTVNATDSNQTIITKEYADDLTSQGVATSTPDVFGGVYLGTATEIASTTFDSNMPTVVPTSQSTSSPHSTSIGAGYVPVSEDDGYIDSDWLRPTDDRTVDNLTVSGDITASSGTSALATTTQWGTYGGLMPTGSITAYAASSSPEGWLYCNGSSLSTSTHSSLFAILGYNYGGNGTSTFAIPDLRGREIMGYGSATTTYDVMGETYGEDEHVQSISEMPAHTHDGWEWDAGAGAGNPLKGSGANSADRTVTQSTGGGNAFNVLDPIIVLYYIIKY